MFLDIIIIFLLFQHIIYLFWTQRPELKDIRDDDKNKKFEDMNFIAFKERHNIVILYY